MPNYQGHLVGGAIAFPITLGLLSLCTHGLTPNTTDIAIWSAMCLLGSLFPDIDIHSMGQKILYRFLTLALLVCLFLGHLQFIVPILAVALFPLFLTHRGLSHTLLFNIVVPLIIPWGISLYDTSMTQSALNAYIFFVSGALSHLILDFGLWGLIKRGIWPRQRPRRKRSHRRN